MRVAMNVLREFGVVAAGGEGAPLKVMRSNEATSILYAPSTRCARTPHPGPLPAGEGDKARSHALFHDTAPG